MSGAVLTGVAAHDSVVLSAEQQRQAATDRAAAVFMNRAGAEPVATELAALKAADIAYARAMKASAIANGISPSIWIAQLVELGTGGL
jgi:hypothetical protein